jgi:hypothetical protein
MCALGQTPMMVIEGNHEIERDAANHTFQAYVHRFKVPYAESGSPSPLFYSFDLAGALLLPLSMILTSPRRFWSNMSLLCPMLCWRCMSRHGHLRVR